MEVCPDIAAVSSGTIGKNGAYAVAREAGFDASRTERWFRS